MSKIDRAPVATPLRKKRASPRSPLQRQKRALKQKRGLGSGAAYQSFIRVERHEFGSVGRSHIWLDPINPKITSHLLSDLERYVLMHLATAGAQVRSQYPLWRAGVEPEFVGSTAIPNSGSVRIAKEMSITHPAMQGEFLVLTLDLLAKFDNGKYLAIYVKYRKDLPPRDSRGYELYQLVKRYWRRRNVPLLVITEEQVKIPETIRWLDWASSIRGSYVPGTEHALLALVRKVVTETDPLSTMHARISALGETTWDVVHAIKYALWTGHVSIDFLPGGADLSEVWNIKLRKHSVGASFRRVLALATKI